MNLKLSQPENHLCFKNFIFDFSKKTCLMGILNITPDSFSDGGMFLKKEEAVRHAVKMEQDGADIIDIGGESTRPGSIGVSLKEELARVIPVIEALKNKIAAPISIDTQKCEVARAAIMAGASIINDTMGAPLDAKMAEVAAEFDVPIIIMHIKGSPRTMQENPVYKDLISEITNALAGAIKILDEKGVAPEKIIIDPGIGFGKTASHNLELLKNLREFKVLNKPIMVGPSRKSFIGSALKVDNPKERLFGTAAAVAIAIAGGADIVRVHDVKEMAQVRTIADAVYKRCLPS